MTRLEKNSIYDEMCHLITDYEYIPDPSNTVEPIDLYYMLVKIQNCWEELTREDE